jgi:hypothetical protein
LYFIPFAVAIAVAVSWFGGLQHTLRIVNDMAADAVGWLTGLL